MEISHASHAPANTTESHTGPRHLTAHPGGRPSGREPRSARTDPPTPETGDGVTASQCPEEPLIGLRVLSVWLGVSESTVRKWAARGPGTGLLPTMIRVNGQLRFRPEDVRSYLREKELR
ncbi:helix-turn-helix domain-containing protein [Nocardioides panacisoli]|uniref:helix-turn-helix domain-containing protein n=1 Tax=Nocardioides panacisoli TaxID=627624 RepID=UPI001C638A99|nr:helix-turn-helix domain-containing protein [Nocardioides panacisoli]QYJ03509.1 helix-turn-helix domain-containing protein [Nocardioides panacisoli]